MTERTGVAGVAVRPPVGNRLCGCPRLIKSGSAALKIRQAALGISLDAFLEILRAAQPILLDQLALGCRLDLVDEPAPYGLACRQHGEGRRLRDFERQG